MNRSESALKHNQLTLRRSHIGILTAVLACSCAWSAVSLAGKPKSKKVQRQTVTKQVEKRQQKNVKRTQAKPTQQQSQRKKQSITSSRSQGVKRTHSVSRQKQGVRTQQSTKTTSDMKRGTYVQLQGNKLPADVAQRGDSYRRQEAPAHNRQHNDHKRKDGHSDRTRIDIDINIGGHGHHSNRNRNKHYVCPPCWRCRPVVYPRCPPVVVRRPVVIRQTTVVCDPYPTRYKCYVECDGWSLLAQGRGYDAVRAFEKEVYLYPNAALPRAGLALAHAVNRDDYDAVHEMRAAFRKDRHAMKYLPLTSDMKYRLRHLINQYEERLACDPYERDWRFMVASLYYLRGDHDRARYEIAPLMQRDWDDIGDAVRNLNALLREDYCEPSW